METVLDFNQSKFDYENASEKEIKVYEGLREWRYKESGKRYQPPFMVITDNMLNELAAKEPKSMIELSEIKGFTQSKLYMYGESILKVISDRNL